MSDVLEKLKQEEKEAEELMFGSAENPEGENPEAPAQEEEVEVDAEAEEEVEAGEAEDPTEPEEKPKSKRVSWKQRYGQYKASTDVTIRDLRRELAAMKVNLEEQHVALSKLRKENYDLALAQSSKKEEDSFDEVFTQEDKDLIGSEAIDIIKKAMKANKATGDSKAEAELKAELAELRKQRKEAALREQKKVNEDSFNALIKSLAKIVPDWDVIDKDPKFEDFLKQIDPHSGRVRFQLLQFAMKSGDVSSVARFYNEFKAQLPKTRAEILEAEVTPSGSNATPNLEEFSKKKTHNIRDYEAFMDAVTRGEWRGKEKEAAKIELMYDRAWQEGRMV